MINKPYRKNVGIMLVDKNGLVWMGKRTNTYDNNFCMQMPQGGIDKGEEPLETAYRELYEETGITKDKVSLLKISDYWYNYEFSPEYMQHTCFRGQTQKWVLFLFSGNDTDFKFDTHPEEIEFQSFNWAPIDDIINMVVPFKKNVYQQVVDEFSSIIKKTCPFDKNMI